MAWSSRNDHIDHPSLSWQYEPGNGDSTLYKEVTITQAPIATAAKPLPTEYSFYDPRVQHAPALIEPDFTSPSNLAPLSLEYMDQDNMQGFFPQWNNTAKGPAATDYHRLAESIVQIPSLDSSSSVEQPCPPKGDYMPKVQGNCTRGRRANKQE